MIRNYEKKYFSVKVWRKFTNNCGKNCSENSGDISEKENWKSCRKTLTYDAKLLKPQQWLQKNYRLNESFIKEVYSEFIEHIEEITTFEKC